jgi:hypothetical protein
MNESLILIAHSMHSLGETMTEFRAAMLEATQVFARASQLLADLHDDDDDLSNVSVGVGLAEDVVD